MDAERWREIERLCQSALTIEPEKREAYLKEACLGDDALRTKVEALLAHQTEAEGFLKDPAIEDAARALAKSQEARIDTDLVGRTLLHYRITGKMGAGGMGVVYLAQDTHLNRSVAIKVLPDLFAEDAERMARFEREARLLATLNHPNIASIHGLEKQDGRSFLVLELVEGLTLEERLRKGPIPIDEAFDICCQIADGLLTAHDKGVIHRDLKPANVKLTAEGMVKILDFGLAKVLHEQVDSVDLTAQDADSMTASGVILGTAAYMSPEQARGKAVDKRTDVWAFGCVLYECLTARKAFEGETLTETVAAILRDEPDWNAIPAATPRNVTDLLHRCLRKDLKARFRDIGDARIELEEARAAVLDRAERTPIGVKSDSQSTPEPEREIREFGQGTQPRQATEHRTKRPYVWAVAAISVVIVVVASIYWISRREIRELKPAPVPVPLTTYTGVVMGASFSPDGNQVAFFWNGEKQDNWDIYIKQIGNESPHRLTTDPHADSWPAWSPDGQSIAFLHRYDEGKAAVMLIPAIGGREHQVTEVQTLNIDMPNRYLSWHPAGKWLAVSCDQESEDAPAAIYLISTETREKRRLTFPPRGVRYDTSPAFSPDGRNLAFVRYVGGTGEIFLLRVSADLMPEGEPKQLTFRNQDTSFPAWMPDGKEIIFASGSKTLAARLWRIPASGSGQPRILPFAIEGGVADMAVALNKERLIYTSGFGDVNIWRLEIPTPEMKPPAPQRFLASSRPQVDVQYSPDGRSVAYGSLASGSMEIWVCDKDGKNPEQLTHLGGPTPDYPRWSPDGQQIIFRLTAQGNTDLYLVPAQGGKTKRLTSTPLNETHPCYSRNGKWVYFASDRTGNLQIWKMPAEGGEAVQITRKGGSFPQDSMDGKTLFYTKRSERSAVTGLRELWEVPADGGEESRVLEDVYLWNFDVKQRGIYFVSKPDRDGTPIVFYEFKSGKSKLIATTQQGVEFGFTVSPDDQTILCVLSGKSRVNLMLVENFR